MFQHEKAQVESKEEVEKSEKGEKKSVFAEDDYDWQDVMRRSIEYANEQYEKTEVETEETKMKIL